MVKPVLNSYKVVLVFNIRQLWHFGVFITRLWWFLLDANCGNIGFFIIFLSKNPEYYDILFFWRTLNSITLIYKINCQHIHHHVFNNVHYRDVYSRFQMHWMKKIQSFKEGTMFFYLTVYHNSSLFVILLFFSWLLYCPFSLV